MSNKVVILVVPLNEAAWLTRQLCDEMDGIGGMVVGRETRRMTAGERMDAAIREKARSALGDPASEGLYYCAPEEIARRARDGNPAAIEWMAQRAAEAPRVGDERVFVSLATPAGAVGLGSLPESASRSEFIAKFAGALPKAGGVASYRLEFADGRPAETVSLSGSDPEVAAVRDAGLPPWHTTPRASSAPAPAPQIAHGRPQPLVEVTCLAGPGANLPGPHFTLPLMPSPGGLRADVLEALRQVGNLPGPGEKHRYHFVPNTGEPGFDDDLSGNDPDVAALRSMLPPASLPVGAPVPANVNTVASLTGELNPFTAAAAATDRDAEGKKRFESLVGIWLQNFGVDGGTQPDRPERMHATFAGFGSGLVFGYIKSKGGLTRAILEALASNSWAAPEERLKVAKRLALNMVQVGTARGVPITHVMETSVLRAPGVDVMGDVNVLENREVDEPVVIDGVTKMTTNEAGEAVPVMARVTRAFVVGTERGVVSSDVSDDPIVGPMEGDLKENA